MNSRILLLTLASILAAFAVTAQDWTPVPTTMDPLVRMPGTQPAQNVNLEDPNNCFACHSGFNKQVEPGFNWSGSMMAQSANDFIFWSCLTVAGQDSLWAIGTPNAVDICERCHFPEGWLQGRSDPPNASAMTGTDFDGVHCDVCHSMYDPHFEATFDGTREGDDWLNYWDETNASTTPSQAAAQATLQKDRAFAANIENFNGSQFFTDDNGKLLPPAGYAEAGSGQYYMVENGEKRGPFADAKPLHNWSYSRYHRSKYFCATCHDVSNPALANLGSDPNNPLPTELNSAHSYLHVERTFSEFMLSAYGAEGGTEGIGPFAPSAFETSTSDGKISRCQDCHMRDVVGKAASFPDVPIRPNDSVEHPNSGQPLHDLTGGNVFVTTVLASTVPGSPNYDELNSQLLNQGAQVLTLDFTQGMALNPEALLAGADRAEQQLLLAASINDISYDRPSGFLTFKVQNQTGHRLISGFPEGRRMFVNIRAYDEDGLIIGEINPFDDAAGTLKGLGYTYADPDTTKPSLPQPMALNEATERYIDELVYEMHPSSTLTGEEQTFHFALADGRSKDNRIPPKGYRIAEATERLCDPVWDGGSAPNYFTPAEYAGGYDEVSYKIAENAERVEIALYYQTTSREYMEFLRNEIRGDGELTLSATSPSLGIETYRVQTDPFFAQLKAWGDTIWLLWKHNYQQGVAGARPVLMASGTTGDLTPCDANEPILRHAVPTSGTVTLFWTDEFASDPNITGYAVYYDQAGKSQFIAQVDAQTVMYTDAGLANGQPYCYKVKALYDTCESNFSNTLCAIPTSFTTDQWMMVEVIEQHRRMHVASRRE